MIAFRITPLQWTPRGPGDAEALAEQFANYLAGLSGPWRMLSLTRRFSFDTLRAELNRQAAALEATREHAPEEFWRWRWTKHYRRMYDDWERLEPPLAVEHYLVYQPAEPLAPQALADTLREQFLLPAVEPAPLPALIPGRYREHATYLEPLDGPRYPFLRILTAYDVRGTWHFASWRPLLMSSWELALCIDVQTLSTDQADRRGTDALNALDQAVNGQFAIPDKRSRRAWESADYALGALDRSALHEVAYAILLRAPTRELLDRETHRLTAALGSRLKLDTVAGAQAAYARLFLPQGARAITEPIVRRNTLSIGVAYKIPWTVRKTARDRGICFGYNRDEGMPILLDVFGDRGDENAHLLAIGQSNSGKTVTLSCLALRLATAGAQVIFFDPVGKCRLLCEAVGPEAAFYEVDTSGSLNILDRMTDDLGTQRAAIERRLSVVLGRPDYGAGRVGLRARELTNLEVGAIDQCLGALYADATRTPLLGDLVRELKALNERPGLEPRVVEAGAELAAEIASVLLGSRGALLNAPTTIRWDFAAPVTGYSFRNVVSTDKALMPLMYDLGWEALEPLRAHAARERAAGGGHPGRAGLHECDTRVSGQRGAGDQSLAQLSGLYVDGGPGRRDLLWRRRTGVAL